MQPGRVIGRVVASSKYETLEGIKLILIQPLDWEKRDVGDPIVAADAVGAGSSELIFWVAAREAAVAFSTGENLEVPPIDAAIVGIVDGINLQEWTRKNSARMTGLV